MFYVIEYMTELHEAEGILNCVDSAPTTPLLFF